MTASKIDRIVSNAELFEQLSALGTQDEAHRFLQEKGVSVIGDLAEPDQHRYFAIKNAPSGELWHDVSVPPTEAPIQPSNPSPKSAPKMPGQPGYVAPKKITGLIPDGTRINSDIQKALVKFYPDSAAWIKIDGIMGPNTRGALNRFKADHHDDRAIDDPEFQSDLMRKGYLPQSVLGALEQQIDAFEKVAQEITNPPVMDQHHKEKFLRRVLKDLRINSDDFEWEQISWRKIEPYVDFGVDEDRNAMNILTKHHFTPEHFRIHTTKDPKNPHWHHQ